jgi:hypothetical protein
MAPLDIVIDSFGFFALSTMSGYRMTQRKYEYVLGGDLALDDFDLRFRVFDCFLRCFERGLGRQFSFAGLQRRS